MAGRTSVNASFYVYPEYGLRMETPSEVDSARTLPTRPLCRHRTQALGTSKHADPPGIYDQVCKIIKTKIDAGVYECSNSSIDRDGLQSLRKGESRFASSIVSNHSTQSPYNIPVFHHYRSTRRALRWPRVWRYPRSLRRLRRANHRRRLARLHDIPDTLRSLPLGYATHGLDEFGSYIP